jgi:hypothetical protein
VKKVYASLALSVALSGCITGPDAPTKLASGASSGIWTSRPADEVRTCIEQVTQTSKPAAVQYEVTPNNTSKTVYATTVSIIDDARGDDKTTEQVLRTCTTPPGAVARSTN